MILMLAAALASASQPVETASCPPGNDAPAVTCRAISYQSEARFDAAAAAFEELAALLPATDPQRDRALAAAGNMWIAADQPGKAALALDRALAGTGLQADQRGEALLDRARAAEAQNDLPTARAKVDEAAQIIGEQPFLWYFSAALAIRENKGAEAESAIDRALALAPDDANVLFEAGHVAHFNDNVAGARAYWTRASQLDPDGRTGAAAREALALLGSPAAVQNGAQAAK